MTMFKKGGLLETLLGSFLGGGTSSSSSSSSSSNGIEDILEDILGGDTSSSPLGGLMDNLGDTVSDLTGIGAVNTEASETAKLSGKEKTSASAKKPRKPGKLTKPSVKDKAEIAREKAREKTSGKLLSGKTGKVSGTSVKDKAEAAKERAREKAAGNSSARTGKVAGSSVKAKAMAARERAKEKSGL